ncbi:type II secretion system protein, partial [Acinetobacter baumannii]
MIRSRPCLQAFTFIEMVIVVSVLALTATFLLPHLYVAQDVARERGFEDRLRALVMTAEKT